MSHYKAPALHTNSFSCPNCGAYAKQTWSELYIESEVDGEDFTAAQGYMVSMCYACDKIGLWRSSKLVYPEVVSSSLPSPNEDLDEDIQEDFIEASKILDLSPRGATAILRLCLQKLCIQLGEKGKNINDDIAALVKKGLSPKIQKALDVVRVIGNNAVHPGEIDLKDDPQTALNLLSLINLIAETMISQPRHIDNLYASLPAAAIQAIEKRDSK